MAARKRFFVFTTTELRRAAGLSPECDELAQIILKAVSLLRTEAKRLKAPLRGS